MPKHDRKRGRRLRGAKQKLLIVHAKAKRKLNIANRSHKTRITKTQFVEALEGTGGVKKTLAERLDIGVRTVDKLLAREDWDDVLELYMTECRSVTDIAESVIIKAMKQFKKNPELATQTAKWYVSKRMQDIYGDKTIIEGGQNPIKTLNAHVQLPLEKLSIETQRAILEAMDEKEKEERLRRDGTIVKMIEAKEVKNKKGK